MTINLSKFPSTIAQKSKYHCIPACVGAILQYHDPSFIIDQDQLMADICAAASDGKPSFHAVANAGTTLQNTLVFESGDFPDYDDWHSNIEKKIDIDRPVAISKRISNTEAHIQAVLGYDNNTREYLLYNPGLQVVQGQIQGGIEKYSYADATADISGQNPCTDQLWIK